jgi:hypothetical protein
VNESAYLVYFFDGFADGQLGKIGAPHAQLDVLLLSALLVGSRTGKASQMELAIGSFSVTKLAQPKLVAFLCQLLHGEGTRGVCKLEGPAAVTERYLLGTALHKMRSNVA